MGVVLAAENSPTYTSVTEPVVSMRVAGWNALHSRCIMAAKQIGNALHLTVLVLIVF